MVVASEKKMQPVWLVPVVEWWWPVVVISGHMVSWVGRLSGLVLVVSEERGKGKGGTQGVEWCKKQSQNISVFSDHWSSPRALQKVKLFM